MIALSDVDWGPTDATVKDDKFARKWIEPPGITNCLAQKNWIVTGEKGSGKSAIRKALREIYSPDYFVVPIVDFDKVKFSALYKNLYELSATTSLSTGLTLSNYWQYSIVLEVVKACAEKAPELYGDLLLSKQVAAHGDLTLDERLMRLAEEAWNAVDRFTKARRRKTTPKAGLLASGGLSAAMLSNLGSFPLQDEYPKLKREFFHRLEQHRHRATLVLDGFDTLIANDISSSSIRLIFSSLVDAILTLRTSEDSTSLFGVKALIPHDRFLSIALRDADKVGGMQTSIRWNRETLREFLVKRIELAPKIKPGTFQMLWKQIMPDTINNVYYRLQEDSFDYLARHTMMRPRQLQIHLESLADNYPNQIIDPSMVPSSLADSSEKLAGFFFDEYRIDYPHLSALVNKFEREINVMEYRCFRDTVFKFVKSSEYDGRSSNALSVEEQVDLLYSIGLFGVVRFTEEGDILKEAYYPPTRESRRHYVDFSFRRPIANVASRLKDETVVAFHPLFLHYANLRPHPTLIIG